jgi:ankyrin repeat protein
LLKNDAGAISQPANNGATALHYACLFQPLEIVKLVYDASPRTIHLQDEDGKTPLNYCVRYAGDIITFVEAQLEWERQAHEQTEPDEEGQLPLHRFLRSTDVSVGTTQLMLSANPESATSCDSTRCNPLHIASKFGLLDVAKLVLNCNEDCVKEVDLSQDLPLHVACREGNCGIINCILERSDYGVPLRNKHGKLPFELAINRLLHTYPDVLECLATNDRNLKDEMIASGDSLLALKRKHESI